jgi:hypothetical protein
MKPCPSALVGGVKCPYDVLFDEFQKPVLQHLVDTGRAQKLAVVYVMNEFGYKSTASDDKNTWGGAANWTVKRAEALAYTADRALNSARAIAGTKVPVGLKFASVTNVNSGWAKDPVYQTDQLAHVLNDTMAPNGDVLGYDLYFGATDFDPLNRNRFSSFLSSFAAGRFEFGEFGRICDGAPGQFLNGTLRTKNTDITGASALWPYDSGLNLFGLNAGNCYALTDPVNINTVYSGAQAEASGMWDLVKATTGSTSPATCCTNIVSSVSPLTATLNQAKTFTVTGSCLPPTLAAWIPDCSGLTMGQITATQASFSCTPITSKGLKAGVIKDKSGGTPLKNFTVTVQ